jgi:Flp pilus assembly protein TadG
MGLNRCTNRKGHLPPHPHRGGAAAVEFAIVAPLFLLLLAGIMEFGQAFRIQHSLSTAARRGARAAVIDGTTTSFITQKVRDQCTNSLGVAPADVSVVVLVDGSSATDVSQAEEGSEITVTVEIPYAKAGLGFYANTFATSTLSARCSLERE